MSSRVLLNPSHKLKSDILESLAEQIIKFKAYPSNLEIESVAEALIKAHPWLREQGSSSGYYGWKISLKYKMANYRTKLRNLGCPEISINSLKNKPADNYQPAYKVKKPQKGRSKFLPPLSCWRDPGQPWRRKSVTVVRGQKKTQQCSYQGEDGQDLCV